MKKVLIFLIVIINIMTLTSAVMAKEITISDSTHDTEESRLKGDGTSAPKEVNWQLVIDGGPSTRYACDDCGFLTASVCAADATFLSVGSHKPLFKPTCFVSYYGSRGAEMCQFCGSIQWVYNGNHLCWEYHDSCSAGWYDVCPMDIS